MGERRKRNGRILLDSSGHSAEAACPEIPLIHRCPATFTAHMPLLSPEKRALFTGEKRQFSTCQAGTQALCAGKEAMGKHKLKLKVPPEKYPVSQGSLAAAGSLFVLQTKHPFVPVIKLISYSLRKYYKYRKLKVELTHTLATWIMRVNVLYLFIYPKHYIYPNNHTGNNAV